MKRERALSNGMWVGFLLILTVALQACGNSSGPDNVEGDPVSDCPDVAKLPDRQCVAPEPTPVPEVPPRPIPGLRVQKASLTIRALNPLITVTDLRLNLGLPFPPNGNDIGLGRCQRINPVDGKTVLPGSTCTTTMDCRALTGCAPACSGATCIDTCICEPEGGDPRAPCFEITQANVQAAIDGDGTSPPIDLGACVPDAGKLAYYLANGTSPVGVPIEMPSFVLKPECDNGVDDDGDHKFDFPDDPDCRSANDVSEAEDCEDGIDNDGDGFTDGADGNCTAGDGSEGDLNGQQNPDDFVELPALGTSISIQIFPRDDGSAALQLLGLPAPSDRVDVSSLAVAGSDCGGVDSAAWAAFLNRVQVAACGESRDDKPSNAPPFFANLNASYGQEYCAADPNIASRTAIWTYDSEQECELSHCVADPTFDCLRDGDCSEVPADKRARCEGGLCSTGRRAGLACQESSDCFELCDASCAVQYPDPEKIFCRQQIRTCAHSLAACESNCDCCQCDGDGHCTVDDYCQSDGGEGVGRLFPNAPMDPSPANLCLDRAQSFSSETATKAAQRTNTSGDFSIPVTLVLSLSKNALKQPTPAGSAGVIDRPQPTTQPIDMVLTTGIAGAESELRDGSKIRSCLYGRNANVLGLNPDGVDGKPNRAASLKESISDLEAVLVGTAVVPDNPDFGGALVEVTLLAQFTQNLSSPVEIARSAPAFGGAIDFGRVCEGRVPEERSLQIWNDGAAAAGSSVKVRGVTVSSDCFTADRESGPVTCETTNQCDLPPRPEEGVDELHVKVGFTADAACSFTAESPATLTVSRNTLDVAGNTVSVEGEIKLSGETAFPSTFKVLQPTPNPTISLTTTIDQPSPLNAQSRFVVQNSAAQKSFLSVSAPNPNSTCLDLFPVKDVSQGCVCDRLTGCELGQDEKLCVDVQLKKKSQAEIGECYTGAEPTPDTFTTDIVVTHSDPVCGASTSKSEKIKVIGTLVYPRFELVQPPPPATLNLTTVVGSLSAKNPIVVKNSESRDSTLTVTVKNPDPECLVLTSPTGSACDQSTGCVLTLGEQASASIDVQLQGKLKCEKDIPLTITSDDPRQKTTSVVAHGQIDEPKVVGCEPLEFAVVDGASQALMCPFRNEGGVTTITQIDAGYNAANVPAACRPTVEVAAPGCGCASGYCPATVCEGKTLARNAQINFRATYEPEPSSTQVTCEYSVAQPFFAVYSTEQVSDGVQYRTEVAMTSAILYPQLSVESDLDFGSVCVSTQGEGVGAEGESRIVTIANDGCDEDGATNCDSTIKGLAQLEALVSRRCATVEVVRDDETVGDKCKSPGVGLATCIGTVLKYQDAIRLRVLFRPDPSSASDSTPAERCEFPTNIDFLQVDSTREGPSESRETGHRTTDQLSGTVAYPTVSVGEPTADEPPVYQQLLDFDRVCAGESVQKSVEIKNTSQCPLTIKDIQKSALVACATVAPTSGCPGGTLEDCTEASLAPGQAVRLAVKYAPIAETCPPYDNTELISVHTTRQEREEPSDSGHEETVRLSGEPVMPDFEVTPNVAFDETCVDTASTQIQTVTISNKPGSLCDLVLDVENMIPSCATATVDSDYLCDANVPGAVNCCAGSDLTSCQGRKLEKGKAIVLNTRYYPIADNPAECTYTNQPGDFLRILDRTVTLTGRVSVPGISVTPEVDFGGVAVDTRVDMQGERVVTIANSNPKCPAVLRSVTRNPDMSAVSDDCVDDVAVSGCLGDDLASCKDTSIVAANPITLTTAYYPQPSASQSCNYSKAKFLDIVTTRSQLQQAEDGLMSPVRLTGNVLYPQLEITPVALVFDVVDADQTIPVTIKNKGPVASTVVIARNSEVKNDCVRVRAPADICPCASAEGGLCPLEPGDACNGVTLTTNQVQLEVTFVASCPSPGITSPTDLLKIVSTRESATENEHVSKVTVEGSAFDLNGKWLIELRGQYPARCVVEFKLLEGGGAERIPPGNKCPKPNREKCYDQVTMQIESCLGSPRKRLNGFFTDVTAEPSSTFPFEIISKTVQENPPCSGSMRLFGAKDNSNLSGSYSCSVANGLFCAAYLGKNPSNDVTREALDNPGPPEGCPEN